MKSYLYISLIILLSLAGIFWALFGTSEFDKHEFLFYGEDRMPVEPVRGVPEIKNSLPLATDNNTVEGVATGSLIFIENVPFTPQAPLAEWSDLRQEDGCEEASVLMAMKWAKGESLTPAEAKSEIIAMADWEEKEYGSYVDTSAEDTLKRLIEGYFGYNNARVVENIGIGDIIAALRAGEVVLAPANGRALGNPNFTAPGPERHMLLIRGYDPATDEFITNDPGTRRGEEYRYKSAVLYAAILDYPTGDHAPIVNQKKAMIVVKK